MVPLMERSVSPVTRTGVKSFFVVLFAFLAFFAVEPAAVALLRPRFAGGIVRFGVSFDRARRLKLFDLLNVLVEDDAMAVLIMEVTITVKVKANKRG